VAIHGQRFDVNCSILFTELPLLKRPTAARAAEFDAVEFWWPFAEPVPADREVDAFIGSLGDAGVRLAALNFAGGDLAAGDRGLLSRPDGSAAFRDNIDVCVGIAGRTGCTVLNALYGNRASGVSAQVQDALAIENLTLAARSAAAAGATVVVEALNSHDTPHAALVSSQSALPGRGAPGTGELDFEALFGQLAAQGYRGWIGLEYQPEDPADSSTSFGWRKAYAG